MIKKEKETKSMKFADSIVCLDSRTISCSFLSALSIFWGVCSQDALHAVLGPIVAPGAPIVYRFRNQAIHVPKRFIKLHSLSVWEKSVLKISYQGLAPLETRQI